MVITRRAEDMETIARNEGVYPQRGEFSSIKAYRTSRKQWYKSTGLLVLEGKEWHDLRSKTQKHLLKPRAVEAYLLPMQEVARDFTERIKIRKDANEEVPEFLEDLYKWALESVAYVGLDTRLGCLDLNAKPDSDGMKMINGVQTMFEMMTKLEAFLGNIQYWKLFRTPSYRKFEKASDCYSEIAFKYIHLASEQLKKLSSEDREPTLLQTMLLTPGLEKEGATVMVADMLLGGIDTTSHTVGFILYELARSMAKQDLLHKEIVNLLPSKDCKITSQIFTELRYLKACIKEGHRLHPVIPVTARVLDREVVISGYRVPPKTVIIVNTQEIGLDERYYQHAATFLPERWMDKDHKPYPFAHMPFGFGPRSCIGRRLAELEIICLLTEIIRNFRVEYHYEDIDIVKRLVNTPDKPLRFKFIDR
ncbi:probable cytochrome P450 301a1, mitochondrial [Uloborus diversus]|uniref:probable cytochrome P450 301a1, mitochondrial n=1 Tax=Uloborus diversus TaxID=327109 RepID=UPI00240A354B|nr:probable cytochrome P450 301a1, mitochondrial [Uloborus diversus]